MLKKFLLFFLSVSFLGISSVYAADDMEENTVKNADVFENNYQNLKESAHVTLSPVEKCLTKKKVSYPEIFYISRDIILPHIPDIILHPPADTAQIIN